jgi:hypothetical protein
MAIWNVAFLSMLMPPRQALPRAALRAAGAGETPRKIGEKAGSCTFGQLHFYFYTAIIK